MMEKDDFIEECLTLCALDKEGILKRILQRQTREDLRSCEMVADIPRGLPVLLHQPCRQNFADYAYEVCSLTESKESITKFLISAYFDEVSVRTRQSKRRKCTRSLPSQLGYFLAADGKTPLGNIAIILDEFFPGLCRISSGVYSDRSKSTILIYVGEDGCKNMWKSAGTNNMLTWLTSIEEEVSKEVFRRVCDMSSVVHVVRKRGSELRYMGKTQKVSDVNVDQGSCVLYVG